MNVDYLANFLLVIESDIDGRSGVDLDVWLVERVVAFFLHVELVLACGERWELAASGEIRLAVERRLIGGLKGDAGAGDGYSVLIYNGDGGCGNRLSCRSADQDERK